MAKHERRVSNQGVTRVLDCCEFSWTEHDGCRVATVPLHAHGACVSELERVARDQGIHLRIEVDPTDDPSVVYPIVVTVTLKGLA